MPRAFYISVLAFSMLALVNAMGPESVFEPTSIPFIPSRTELASRHR